MVRNKKLSIFLFVFMFFAVVGDVYAKNIPTATLSKQEQATTAYLDKIRPYAPELTVFMNKFPKGADIHNHLTGAFFIDEILVYGAENNYLYDLVEHKMLPPDAKKTANVILVSELLQRSKDLVKFLDIISMRGFYKNTMNGSDHFFQTFYHIPSAIIGPEHTARVLARNHGQGVYYLELMHDVLPADILSKTSSYLAETDFNVNDLENAFKKVAPYLQSKEFSNAVKDALKKKVQGIDKALREQYNLTMVGESPDIMVKFIPHLYRHQNNYDLFIRAVISLMATKIDKNVIATNLVQCEAHPLALQNFDKQMEILDFLYKKLDKPNILLHAGELSLREASLESMRDRISTSITKGHALRIGHGTSIAWEKDPHATMNMMKERGIPVEICLSSSADILDIVGNEHPLKLYLNAGVPVTINTDDEGVSRSNLSNEYVRAAQEHDLSYAILKQIARNALEYSLLEGESIYTPKNKNHIQKYTVKPKYKQYIESNKKLTISDVGEKAYFQIKHEQDLAKFERQYTEQ